MTSPIKIAFSTTEYERSHCRQPRGRGSWAFQITEINTHRGEGELHLSPAMSLTEAKRWAKARIAQEARSITNDAASVIVSILP